MARARALVVYVVVGLLARLNAVEVKSKPGVRPRIRVHQHQDPFSAYYQGSSNQEAQDCKDKDVSGQLDSWGFSCSYYKRVGSKFCNVFDDEDFNASDLCCTCNGGARGDDILHLQWFEKNSATTGGASDFGLVDLDQDGGISMDEFQERGEHLNQKAGNVVVYCLDLDTAQFDNAGQSCSAYGKEDKLCEAQYRFNKQFNASLLCCACGGGDHYKYVGHATYASLFGQKDRKQVFSLLDLGYVPQDPTPPNQSFVVLRLAGTDLTRLTEDQQDATRKSLSGILSGYPGITRDMVDTQFGTDGLQVAIAAGRHTKNIEKLMATRRDRFLSTLAEKLKAAEIVKDAAALNLSILTRFGTLKKVFSTESKNSQSTPSDGTAASSQSQILEVKGHVAQDPTPPNQSFVVLRLAGDDFTRLTEDQKDAARKSVTEVLSGDPDITQDMIDTQFGSEGFQVTIAAGPHANNIEKLMATSKDSFFNRIAERLKVAEIVKDTGTLSLSILNHFGTLTNVFASNSEESQSTPSGAIATGSQSQLLRAERA